jgi:hypothetical protein
LGFAAAGLAYVPSLLRTKVIGELNLLGFQLIFAEIADKPPHKAATNEERRK